MKCPNCGNDIPSVAKFCPKCGVAVSQMPVDKLNNDTAEVPASYTDRVDTPIEIMPDSDAVDAGNDKLQNNGKKSFEWKEKHTYITIGAGLVLAVIIGFVIRITKSNSVNDSYFASKQDSDYEQEYDYYEGANAVDSDTDSAQEYFYDEEDDQGNYEEEMGLDINDEEVVSNSETYNNTGDAVESENYYEEDSGESEYILPGSDSRYLDEADLYDLSDEECRLARNELYARHGRKFDDEGLRTYFESKDWYSGTIDPSDFKEEMLNDYEIYNRDLIVEYEKKQGYR